MNKKVFFSILLSFSISLLPLLSGCAKEETYYVEYSLSQEFYVEGERLSQREREELQADITILLQEIEDAVSTEKEESDLFRIGKAEAGQKVSVGEHVSALLHVSESLYQVTGGAFSPALYNLSELWGFTPEFEGRYNQPRPEPSETEIAIALNNSKFDDIHFSFGEVTKLNGSTKLDFGGIAKGYMSDCVRQYLQNKFSGKNIDGILSVMNSNIVLLGEKRLGNTTRGYSVGIENPRIRTTGVEEVAFAVGVSDVAISTSADTYRFYVNNGKIYSHIINPKTGKPSDNGVISITVFVPLTLANASSVADVFSTMGFCMPLSEALSFYGKQSEKSGIGAVVVTSDFHYYVVGNYDILSRREYAELTKPEIADTIEDVFVRAEVEDASDTVVSAPEEIQYIEYVEEMFG